MSSIKSKFLPRLESWQYEVSNGYTLRGQFTPPTGKPVLHFVHGNGFCSLVYEKFLSPFQEHFDLFLSNAQGHGDSDSGEGFTHWNQSARDLSEVWQHYSSLWADVQKIACGHSFGAINSLLIMSKHSGLFDQAVLLDPIIGPPSWTKLVSVVGVTGLAKRSPLAKQARARATSWPNRPALWEYFHGRGTFKAWDDDCLNAYFDYALNAEEDGSYSLKCPPHIESGIFASYARGVWSSIRRIKKPVSLYYGDQSFSFLRKAIKPIQRANPGFRCHSIPGGHCFMQTDPVTTSATVLTNLIEEL